MNKKFDKKNDRSQKSFLIFKMFNFYRNKFGCLFK